MKIITLSFVSTAANHSMCFGVCALKLPLSPGVIFVCRRLENKSFNNDAAWGPLLKYASLDTEDHNSHVMHPTCVSFDIQNKFNT